MQCPGCGYMMTAFDKDCPRCVAVKNSTHKAPEVFPCPACGLSVRVGAISCPHCRYSPHKPPVPPISRPTPVPDIADDIFPVSGIVSAMPTPKVRLHSKDAIEVARGTHPVGFVVLLSLVCIPGMASMVNRQYGKGFFYIVATVAAAVLTSWIFCIGVVPVTLIAVLDSIVIGCRLNRGEIVEQWQFF